MTGIRIESKVHFKRRRRSKKQLRTGSQPSPASGRIPRVSKLMALAIRFEEIVVNGVVADHAELSRLGHVTRSRMTQIMNLLHLAPDIQDAILCLPRVECDRDPVTERELRATVAEVDWERQREIWDSVVGAF